MKDKYNEDNGQTSIDSRLSIEELVLNAFMTPLD